MSNIISFYKYKDLFIQLTLREIKARYNQSVLGYAWAILVPLLNLAVLSIIFSQFLRIPTQGIPYPIFLFVALVPWMFLANSLTSATGSILANNSLITKVSLPREILPLAAISSKLIDFLLTLIILLFLLIFSGVKLEVTLLFFPLIFLIQFMLVFGLSLILSAANTFYRDIENVLGVFITLWMYLTPVLYSTELVPENSQSIYFLNPMVGIINSYREIILFGNPPILSQFLYSFIISLSVLTLGCLYFKNRARYFADVI